MIIKAEHLRPGDLVDLEADSYADPKHDHPLFPFELQTVANVIRETPNCVAVGFEGFDVVGFPPEHFLTVERN